MRKIVPLALSAALVMTAAPSPVMAKGCLRGAVAGGVAGHYMHHHAIMGAMGGCIAAHQYYKHKERRAVMMHNGAVRR